MIEHYSVRIIKPTKHPATKSQDLKPGAILYCDRELGKKLIDKGVAEDPLRPKKIDNKKNNK